MLSDQSWGPDKLVLNLIGFAILRRLLNRIQRLCSALTLNIIFHDRHFIAVNKPAGIGVGADDSGDDTLLGQVRRWNESRQVDGRKGYCVPIHFLDRPVSGVVLFGLSSKGAARLNEQFRNHTIRKTYLAIVEGAPAEDSGRLLHALKKIRERNQTVVTHQQDPDGKASELSYHVVSRHGGYSVLAVTPKTGRSHQIRVQLTTLNTPIVGDVKYGANGGWLGRIALHAAQLQLKHPVDKDILTLEAPLPEEWIQRFGRTKLAT